MLLQVRGKLLQRSMRTVKLGKLSPDTRYLICVVGLGNWATGATGDNTTQPLLSDSPSTRCTEVRTLEAPVVGEGLPKSGSILTRRLGLIVGSCMGFVVFIVLVSVLGYLKLKKQRVSNKREQPLPQEYISYRHFSIQSGDNTQAVNIGTTSLTS
jgi:hypothetical protein